MDGDLLKFRARFGSGLVSSSSSSQDQFTQWSQVMGLSDLQDKLSSNIADLRGFLSFVMINNYTTNLLMSHCNAYVIATAAC